MKKTVAISEETRILINKAKSIILNETPNINLKSIDQVISHVFFKFIYNR